MKTASFTEAIAREMLAILSANFNVTGVTFRWSRARRGKHYYNDFGLNQVTVPHPNRGRSFEAQEQSFLHEFAHAVAHFRDGEQGKGHGANFQEILFEVAKAWHGDPAKYNWSREYATVKSAAERMNRAERRANPLVWNDETDRWEPAK